MDKQIVTQLANIEKRTGQSVEQLADIVRSSGLTRHGELRDRLMAAIEAFGPCEIAPKQGYLSLRRKK